jgi:hypothetical protein
MVALKWAEQQTIEDAFDMRSGYVLDFTDRTFAAFFGEGVGVNIDDAKYRSRGTSKANRLRTFIASEDAFTVARALRGLWDHRESVLLYQDAENATTLKVRLFAVIAGIEGTAVPRTDAIDQFAPDETLEELVAAINRDIAANKPGATLDRLHTYCMKKFGHLLEQRQIGCTKDEPLHSRMGKYMKALSQERELGEMTKQVIRNYIGIFAKFNYVRNNQSLAHDNELLDPAEARFIYDAITAFLFFIKSIEANRFGA